MSRILPSKKVEEDTTCSMDQRSGLLDKKNTWCNIFIWELHIYKPMKARVPCTFSLRKDVPFLKSAWSFRGLPREDDEEIDTKEDVGILVNVLEFSQTKVIVPDRKAQLDLVAMGPALR
jgi:hypothetical protein